MRIDENIRRLLAETELLHVGGEPIDSQATLCIYCDDLDPNFVTQTVRCSPTQARSKGERYPDRPRIPPAIMGQWFLEAPDNLSYNDKIEFLLTSTTDAEEDWQMLAEFHDLYLRTAIFLHTWTEGFDLSNDTLARISRRKWSFGLAIYSAEGEEILDAFLRRD